MPVNLQKGQKVSLTKGNPGLKNVMVGLGWDVNQFDTGADFDLDTAAFLLTDSGKVADSGDFVFYGNLKHASGSVQHMGDNLTGAGDGDPSQSEESHKSVHDITQEQHIDQRPDPEALAVQDKDRDEQKEVKEHLVGTVADRQIAADP